MKRIDQLKIQARREAIKKGHNLRTFLIVQTITNGVGKRIGEMASTVCDSCEKGVVVSTCEKIYLSGVTRPNDYIAGRLTWDSAKCKRDASLLPTSCRVCGNEMEGKRRCPLCGSPEGYAG